MNQSDVIFAYTRADAIFDGELIDVSEHQHGFTCPIAFTRSLWETIKDIPKNCPDDVNGRVHDVLFVAYIAARNTRNKCDTYFKVSLFNRVIRLRLSVHGGDEGELVITIGFPEDF